MLQPGSAKLLLLRELTGCENRAHEQLCASCFLAGCSEAALHCCSLSAALLDKVYKQPKTIGAPTHSH